MLAVPSFLPEKELKEVARENSRFETEGRWHYGIEAKSPILLPGP